MRRVCGGSYQWDVQATVLRVAKSMRERGFRVWMDTEMMSGSTLDAMAAAVEGAHCVLICITERYKVRARSILLTVFLAMISVRSNLTRRLRRHACRQAPTAGSRAHVRVRRLESMHMRASQCAWWCQRRQGVLPDHGFKKRLLADQCTPGTLRVWCRVCVSADKLH